MRGGTLRAVGLLSALALADSVNAAGTRVITALPEHPTLRMPASARGNGPRSRPSNKGGYVPAADKKRKRKLALQSRRRNRSRS